MSDKETIARGYPPEAAGRICVDFDGTIYPFGALMSGPPPLPGAVEALSKLARNEFHITIYTARLDPDWLSAHGFTEDDQREYIERVLHRDGIPHNRIIGKPAAMAYVDDRALRFTDGEWGAITDWLLWDEPA